MSLILMNAEPDSPVHLVYDTAAGVPVIGVDADHSSSIVAPSFIQIEALPAGTTVQLQQRIHNSASWVNVGPAYTSVDGASIIQFNKPTNFVQIVRTAGTGAVKAYAQR